MTKNRRLYRRIQPVLLVVALSAATPIAGASGKGRSLHGYGAPFRAWVTTHPRNTAQCPMGFCYGPVVSSRSPIAEFSFVTNYKNRVVGYDQALKRGTPLLQAELHVAEQFPSDVAMASSVIVIRHDRYGHSCAVYDLYSKTLARIFGPKGPGQSGNDIGVELATILPSGNTSYSTRAIDLAIVTPVYLDRSTNC